MRCDFLRFNGVVACYCNKVSSNRYRFYGYCANGFSCCR